MQDHFLLRLVSYSLGHALGRLPGLFAATIPVLVLHTSLLVSLVLLDNSPPEVGDVRQVVCDFLAVLQQNRLVHLEQLLPDLIKIGRDRVVF
jgi:hypothetical protein